MAVQRKHHFQVVAKYGPPELFKALKNTVEDNRFKKFAPAFEFDWLKRKVEITANSHEGAEEVLEQFIRRVNEKAGTGLLLPGAAVKREQRTVIPVGILLQTADIYAEVVIGSLREFGVRGIELSGSGDEFAIPLTAINRALEYAEVISTFPLPGYLKIEDRGIHEKSPG
jgi:hypothetical protein